MSGKRGVRAPALNVHLSTLPVGYGAYSNDGCRCEGCRAANVERTRETREWYRAHPELVPAPHGTLNRYANYSCRCDECRRANADYARDHSRRKREAAS